MPRLRALIGRRAFQRLLLAAPVLPRLLRAQGSENRSSPARARLREIAEALISEREAALNGMTFLNMVLQYQRGIRRTVAAALGEQDTRSALVSRPLHAGSIPGASWQSFAMQNSAGETGVTVLTPEHIAPGRGAVILLADLTGPDRAGARQVGGALLARGLRVACLSPKWASTANDRPWQEAHAAHLGMPLAADDVGDARGAYELLVQAGADPRRVGVWCEPRNAETALLVAAVEERLSPISIATPGGFWLHSDTGLLRGTSEARQQALLLRRVGEPADLLHAIAPRPMQLWLPQEELDIPLWKAELDQLASSYGILNQPQDLQVRPLTPGPAMPVSQWFAHYLGALPVNPVQASEELAGTFADLTPKSPERLLRARREAAARTPVSNTVMLLTGQQVKADWSQVAADTRDAGERWHLRSGSQTIASVTAHLPANTRHMLLVCVSPEHAEEARSALIPAARSSQIAVTLLELLAWGPEDKPEIALAGLGLGASLLSMQVIQVRSVLANWPPPFTSDPRLGIVALGGAVLPAVWASAVPGSARLTDLVLWPDKLSRSGTSDLIQQLSTLHPGAPVSDELTPALAASRCQHVLIIGSKGTAASEKADPAPTSPRASILPAASWPEIIQHLAAELTERTR